MVCLMAAILSFPIIQLRNLSRETFGKEWYYAYKGAGNLFQIVLSCCLNKVKAYRFLEGYVDHIRKAEGRFVP